jgi:hypothetical protein
VCCGYLLLYFVIRKKESGSWYGFHEDNLCPLLELIRILYLTKNSQPEATNFPCGINLFFLPFHIKLVTLANGCMPPSREFHLCWICIFLKNYSMEQDNGLKSSFQFQSIAFISYCGFLFIATLSSIMKMSLYS